MATMLMRGLLLSKRGTFTSSYQDALCIAAQCGHTAIIKVLLKQGAKVNEKNSNGQFPLMLAVQCGQIEAAQLLYDEGANIDVRFTNGNPIIHLEKREHCLLA